MQISTIVQDALMEINAVSSVDEAIPQDHSLALRKLNRIISLYNTQDLITAYTQNITLTMPEGGWTSPIEIGAGLQFDRVAPMHIDSMLFSQTTTDYPLRTMAHDQWNEITVKSVKAIPKRYYTEISSENTIKIYFDVIPLDDLELKVKCKLPMNDGVEFVGTDDVIFSYGVEKLLVDRLALELCGPFEVVGRELDLLLGKVQDAENNIKSNNHKPSTLRGKGVFGNKRRSDRRNRARY